MAIILLLITCDWNMLKFSPKWLVYLFPEPVTISYTSCMKTSACVQLHWNLFVRYQKELRAEYKVQCGHNEMAFYNITHLNMRGKDCSVMSNMR